MKRILLALVSLVVLWAGAVSLAAGGEWTETFESSSALDEWIQVFGDWSIVEHEGDLVLVQNEAQIDGVIVYPLDLPDSFILSADLKFTGERRWAGVVFYFLDESSYYTIRTSGGRDPLQILARVPQGEGEDADKQWIYAANRVNFPVFTGVPLNEWFTLEVHKFSNELEIRINGELITAPIAKELYRGGYVGLFSRDSDSTTFFRNISVKPLE